MLATETGSTYCGMGGMHPAGMLSGFYYVKAKSFVIERLKLDFYFSCPIEKIIQQDSTPVGCVPTAAVASTSGGGGLGYVYPSTLPLGIS